MKRILASGLFIVFITTSSNCVAHKAQVLVGPTGKIQKGFKTYSLFLICNPHWLGPQRASNLLSLYGDFEAFGRTIGDNNLAVWFWKSPNHQRLFPAFAEYVDVERSARFCKAWNLQPSVGPHLVVTSEYPNESRLSSGLPKDSGVFELGNMDKDQISKLLSQLTDELLKNGKPKSPSAGVLAATPKPPIPPALWIRLLAAVQRTINDFGCAWNFKVDAGPVKAELHSCQPQS
jgi:hypothetical protein